MENAKHKESIPNLKLLLLEIVLAQFSNAKVSERTKEPRGKEVAKMFRMNAETFRARIAEMGRQEGRAEGHIEERRKNARSMFLEGLSTEAVQRITGLSDEEMRTLRNGSH